MSSLLFTLHGVTLGLAWFAIANAVATLGPAWMLRHPPRQQRVKPAGWWLAMRLFPAAASTVLVAALFVPSYWMFEPRDYDEGFQAVIALMAFAGVSVLAAAAGRAGAAWTRAERRARAWMSRAQPIALPGTPAPAFAVDCDAPVMALVGIFRPRLFVSRSVLSLLNEEELAAAVAHEAGHRRAFDNLKRLAVCAAPDWFAGTRTARNLEQQWASAAEHEADRSTYAIVEGRARTTARCALASAIVKVARLTPPSPIVAEPISTLVDGSDIQSRVCALLDGAAPVEPRRRWRTAVAAAAAIVALVAAIDAYSPLLRGAHEATELLVHLLP